MVVVVMFWAAAIALIFFLLGVVFKGLYSAIIALLTSIGDILGIGMLSGFTILALYVLRAMLNIIVAGEFLDMLGEIIWLMISLGILIGIIVCLLAAFTEVFGLMFGYVLMPIAYVLESAVRLCDKIYYHFLRVIVNQLDKC